MFKLTVLNINPFPWQVKLSGIRLGKITKEAVLASLGGKLRVKEERIGQISPVYLFPDPEILPWRQVKLSCVRHKGGSLGQFRKERVKEER